MLNSIRYGLSNLSRFSGRDSRSEFWPYAAFVLLLFFVAGPIISAPAFFWGQPHGIDEFAAAHPDLVVVHRQSGRVSYEIKGYHPELLINPIPIACATALFVLGLVALLAAAVTRRLHDVGVSAYWGLLPIPFVVFALVATPMLFGRFSGPRPPDFRLVFALFLNNVLYMAALVLLVVLLARRSAEAAKP